MSQKIRISKDKNEYFGFTIYTNIIPLNLFDFECSFCGCRVNPLYAYLINKLKDTSLLENDYPMMCCTCFEIHEYLGFVRCKRCGSRLKADWRMKRMENDLSEMFYVDKSYKCVNCGERYESKD